MNSTLKSIGAVLAGMILIVVLSVATDTILESRNIFPPQNQPGLYSTWMLAVALLLSKSFWNYGWLFNRIALTCESG